MIKDNGKSQMFGGHEFVGTKNFTGKMPVSRIYYTCPFVPAELIAACGLMPHRVSPVLDRDERIEGMCSFAEAWLEFLENKGTDAAAIFTTSCDQMRRAFELSTCGRSFLLNVPSMTGARAFDYYLSELRRLEEFLCGISGHVPDWNRIVDFQSHHAQADIPESKRFKIAVTGGPVNESIMRAIKSLIETAGGVIAVNATENNLRPEGLSKLLMSGNPLEETAAAYFETTAIWRRPNKGFFEWFVKRCNKINAKGIILLRHSFCDLWRCSGQELSKQSSIPVLELELDGKGELSTWAISRVEAFTEGLKK